MLDHIEVSHHNHLQHKDKLMFFSFYYDYCRRPVLFLKVVWGPAVYNHMERPGLAAGSQFPRDHTSHFPLSKNTKLRRQKVFLSSSIIYYSRGHIGIFSFAFDNFLFINVLQRHRSFIRPVAYPVHLPGIALRVQLLHRYIGKMCRWRGKKVVEIKKRKVHCALFNYEGTGNE